MGKINILDQDTINKIAAGEVVERPASVVKELLENAVDAGATAVSVYIEGGGADLIRITDNGSGFEQDDIRVAFKKNTTSKIKDADDLAKVMTFGFRGEALSSIAAVARVELLTKKRDDFMGIRYVCEGGEEKSYSEAGCPDGTTFVVKDLFFNIPVRRKFLKSATTEAGYVGEVCERMALAHPEVAVKFVNNGKQMLSTTGNGNLKEVVYLIYGRSCAEQLLRIDVKENDLWLSGVIAKPIISRGNRNHECFFLNGRYVRTPVASKAIEEGYKTYLMQNRFPLTVLSLSMPPEGYDVNVHPSKLDVKFADPGAVYEFIFKAVFNTVKYGETIVESHIDEPSPKDEKPVVPVAPEPFERVQPNDIENQIRPLPFDDKTVTTQPYVTGQRTAGSVHDAPPFEIYLRQDATDGERLKAARIQQSYIDGKETVTESGDTNEERTASGYVPTRSEETVNGLTSEKTGETDTCFTSGKAEETVNGFSNEKTEENVNGSVNEKPEQLAFLTPEARKAHRIIGQLFDTYWLIEYDEKLYIIDQHAAHERVLFEKFSKEIRENKVCSQLLYPAPVLELTLSEADKLGRIMDKLNSLGYEIEHFGGRQYRILAVPELLPQLSKVELLTDFIDDLTEDVISGTIDSVKDRIATMSCKAAVKGNMKLSFEEASKLIDSLLDLENPFHCPHGRPIEISFSKTEIEKKFKRIV
jgi:DNA mismatch repair protein MutL